MPKWLTILPCWIDGRLFTVDDLNRLKRAGRTVFVSNLHLKVNEKDLFLLFTRMAGKVSDIFVICDKVSRRSKGFAYVELDTDQGHRNALRLSGSELYGQAMQVRSSEVEKNLEWSMKKISGLPGRINQMFNIYFSRREDLTMSRFKSIGIFKRALLRRFSLSLF